jgi:hypothetical protein
MVNWLHAYPKYYLLLELNIGIMADNIIIPITSDGKITIPRELIEKFELKDLVEVAETHCSQGILIKKHE